MWSHRLLRVYKPFPYIKKEKKMIPLFILSESWKLFQKFIWIKDSSFEEKLRIAWTSERKLSKNLLTYVAYAAQQQKEYKLERELMNYFHISNTGK